MSSNSLRICQLNDYDVKGGAEKVSLSLHLAYLALGYRSELLVGKKFYNYPYVTELHSRLNFGSGIKGQILARGMKSLTSYDSIRFLLRGMDDFYHPSSHGIIDLCDDTPDIFHAHNLHGNYFDPRALIAISNRIPTFFTLHDAGMFCGSRLHSMNCEGWKYGCTCCDRSVVRSRYKRYGAKNNWQFKKMVYENCCFFVATPSQWLMNKVSESILRPAIIESKVINNGVDMSVFFPGNKNHARKTLKLPLESIILLFVANIPKKNLSKDFITLQQAVTNVGRKCSDKKILFVVLGENAPPEKIGPVDILYIPFQADSHVIALYYQACGYLSSCCKG